MIFVLLFGFGMSIFGFYMSIKPTQFSKGIIQFSEKSWFHLFEITTRFVLGGAFIAFSQQTNYPRVVFSLGIIFCIASVFLLLLGSKKHRQFAVFISEYLKNKFRYIGYFAIILGAVIMYIAVAGKIA